MASLLGQLFYIGRKRLGLSQRQAAREVQISQPYLSVIERGKCVPRDPILHRLRSLYRIDARAITVALEGRKDEPEPPRRCARVAVLPLLTMLLPCLG